MFRLTAAWAVLVVLPVSLGIAGAPTAFADIVVNNFDTAEEDFLLNGTALISAAQLKLAGFANRGAGSAWYHEKQDVANGFSTTFQFRIGGQGGDGLALVIQNQGPDALGAGGMGNGYHGIRNSVAIEWDTWYNGADGNGDPSANHISVNTRGVLSNHNNHAYSLGSFTDYVRDFQDGLIHDVTIEYEPGTLRIFSNNSTDTPTLEVALDLQSLLDLDGGTAYVGFTASTGFGVQDHLISSWEFTPVAEPGDGTFVWDGAGDGNWSDLNWLENGAPAAVSPDENTVAIINDRIVTVDGDRKAVELSVTTGDNPTGVVIAGNADAAAAGKLSLAGSVNFGSGTSLTMGQNATLVAGDGGAIDSVVTGGSSTFDVDGNLPVTTWSDGTTAGTLTKAGEGTLSLDNFGGTVDLDNTTLKVSGGTLALTGIDRRVGSTVPIQLDGGTLRIAGIRDPGPVPGLPAIDGLQLHLDGGDVNGDGSPLADGAAVATWVDKSGNGFNATASGDPTYRAGALAGNGVVRFDGNDGFTLGNLGSAFPSGASLFVVATLDNDPGYNLLTTRNDDTWWRWTGNGLSYPGTFRTNRVERYALMPTEGSHVFEVVSSPSRWDMLEDGVSLRTVGPQFNPGNDYRIGMPDNTDANKYLNGDIAEILIYDTALTEQQQNDVRYHLQQKYALGPIAMTDTDFMVTRDSTIDAATNSSASFGQLTLLGGIITTTGAAGGMSFTRTIIADGATAVGVAPDVPTDFGLGGIDGSTNSVQFVLTKAGSQPLTIEPGDLVGMTRATIDAREGVLAMVGDGAWAGSTGIQLSGGLMTIAGEIEDIDPGNIATLRSQAYYSFDNENDPGRNDAAGGTSAATLNGVAWSGDGVTGGAVELDGGTDFVSATMNVSETAYAVSLWIKADADSKGILSVNESDLAGAHDRHIFLNNGSLATRVYSEETISAASVFLADGTWHNVIHTFGGSEGGQKIYLDGALVAEGTKANSDFDWERVVNIGYSAEAASPFFDGLIDEVSIYSVALTASDATALAGTRSTPDMSGHDVAVTADSTLKVVTGGAVTFRDLTLEGGMLTIAGNNTVGFNSMTVDVDPASGLEAGVNLATPTTFGAGPVDLKAGVLATAGRPVTFNGIKIAADAEAVGFNFQAETTYGRIDGSMSAAVISKTGPGTMVLNENDAVNFGGATLDARGGTLALGGSAAWAGATEARLSGGTLRIHADPITGGTGLKAGLVGAWLFDEGAGSVAGNKTFNGDGEITGAAWVDDPQRGWVLDFEDNDQVLVPAAPFASVDEAITVAFWQYGDPAIQPQSDTIFQGWIGGARAVSSHIPWGDSSVYWDAGGARSCCNDRSSLAIPPADFEGRWNHWAFTKDVATGEMKIFINGVQRHSVDGRVIPLGGIDRMYIGSEGDHNYYDGMIDEFLVYDRALGLAEVRDLYNDGITFEPVPAIDMTDKNFTVTADSTLRAATDSTAAFGNLAHEGGMLTIGGAPGGVSFTSLTVNATGELEAGIHAGTSTSFGNDPVDLQAGVLATAGPPITFNGVSINAVAGGGTVGFNPQTQTDFGGIDGNGLTVNVAKTGPGIMTLTDGDTSEMNNVTWVARGGTLKMVGTAAWGGSKKAVLDGGTLVLTDVQDPTPVDPLTIPGLKLHLAADAIENLANGATVSRWNDLSANNNHATLSKGAPIYRVDANGDGFAAVEFPEGAGMLTPLTVAGHDYAVFIVFDSDRNSGVNRRAIHGSNNWLIGPYQDQLGYHMGGWAYRATAYMPVDEFVVAEASNSAAAWAFYEDGVQRAAGGGSRGAPGRFSFGAENPWNERLLGDIAEVLIFDRTLDLVERNRIGFYLQDKYALETEYSNTVGALAMTDYDLTVTADSTLNATTYTTADLGALTLLGGVITVTGAPGGIRFTSLTVNATGELEAGIHAGTSTSFGNDPVDLRAGVLATMGPPITFNGVSINAVADGGSVGFNPQTQTDFGGIDGNGLAVKVAKTGPGVWTLVDGDASEMDNATWVAKEGTLRMIGNGAWAGATEAQLSGGTLILSAATIPISHPSGTAAYYSFDDVTGNTVPNGGTAANKDGTLTDGASITVSGGGQRGRAMTIADNSDQRLVVDTGGVDLGEQWTISSWFYNLHPSDTWRSLARGQSGDHQIMVESGSNDLGSYMNGDGNFRDSGADLAPGSGWHQVTAVGSGTTTELYVDGTHVGTSDRKSISEVTWIGNYSASQPFAQRIDEFYIYDRALGAEEVEVLYQESAVPPAVLPPVVMTDKNFTVTADSQLIAASDTTAFLGDLTIQGSAALTLSYTDYSFDNVAASDGASIVGDLSVRGTLSAGNSPGTLNILGNLTIAGTSIYRWELGDSGADLLDVDGNLTLADGWTLQLADAGAEASDADLLLFTVSGDVNLGQVDFDLSQVTGWRFDNPSVYQQGTNVYISGVTVVPEPSTIILLGIGAIGVLVRAWRKRRRT